MLKYWPQLLAICIVCISFGANLNSLETVFAKLTGIEEEHDHDIGYLNEEDDGVRSDFERADECAREAARLENEVLYWKLKYEMK